MPSVNAAWRRAEGDPDWFKTGALSNITAGKLAKQFTIHNEFSSVMLGKNSADGKSYVDKAIERKATYFSMPTETWNKLSSNLHNDEMWKINERFLKQQIKQKKDIYLSHDRTTGTALSFLPKKVIIL